MIYRATAKIVVGILLFCSLFLTPLTVKQKMRVDYSSSWGADGGVHGEDYL